MAKKQQAFVIKTALKGDRVEAEYFVNFELNEADKARALRKVLCTLCDIVLMTHLKGGLAGLLTAEEKDEMRKALESTSDFVMEPDVSASPA